ncbi:MAG TPA: hypothetical protein VF658_18540 [Pyrinomonadaceae bacterium]|jgi:hypothetical protein
MKPRYIAIRMLLVKLCVCLCVSAALVGCVNNANVQSTDNRSASRGGESRAEEVCRRYASCGCQSFDDCMSQIGSDPAIDQPGIGDCMLKSSCQSLCAGRPDGCPKTGTGAGNPGGGQQRSNCSAIPCSKNSDCPSDCYGGCDGVICYSF